MDTNVEEYQTQLEAVEQALATATNDDEKASLKSLKTDLLELLELTKQTAELAQLNAKQDESHNDDLADEMKQFMHEIKQLDAEQEPAPDVEKELNELKSQLETMVGQKCSAPHEHSWGARAYHNAIVCGIDDELHVSNDGAPDVCLRVLFTNPTHREMLPCSFFLEGECKFDAANCHYSHGELVPFSALRDYTEPDFGKLARNCVVLAKLEDRLWHKARVLCANFVEKECRVRLEGQHKKTKELDIAFESLLPIFHDEDLSSGSSSDETDSEDLEALEADRRAQLVQQSLFSFAPSQPLGEWEKHTRGIGSKLLAKMGYVVGTGLGWHGRGIVTPISAEVLPQGCSLDYCMALREAANNDKSLFCVEKKLQRDAKRQEVLNAKAYAREAQKVDVFSFLNETILNNNQTTKGAASTPGCSRTQQPKETLQTQSAKSLNVQSVRIADDIRKKERELSGLQQSLRRNSSGSEVHKRLQTQLTAKSRELDALKQSEHLLAKEQATRKTKNKLCIF